jgi:hypothetical protein
MILKITRGDVIRALGPLTLQIGGKIIKGLAVFVEDTVIDIGKGRIIVDETGGHGENLN